MPTLLVIEWDCLDLLAGALSMNISTMYQPLIMHSSFPQTFQEPLQKSRVAQCSNTDFEVSHTPAND